MESERQTSRDDKQVKVKCLEFWDPLQTMSCDSGRKRVGLEELQKEVMQGQTKESIPPNHLGSAGPGREIRTAKYCWLWLCFCIKKWSFPPTLWKGVKKERERTSGLINVVLVPYHHTSFLHFVFLYLQLGLFCPLLIFKDSDTELLLFDINCHRVKFITKKIIIFKIFFLVLIIQTMCNNFIGSITVCHSLKWDYTSYISYSYQLDFSFKNI